MISKAIWFYALLCVLVKSKKSVTVFAKTSRQNQMNFYVSENERLVNTSFADESREVRPNKEVKVIKRGIVLVDEDFDVPSAIYAHENSSGTDVSLRAEIFDRNEGSGSDVLDEKELNNATKYDSYLHTEYYSTSTLSTEEMKQTEAEDITLSTDTGGSGDGIPITKKEYSVTEVATTRHTEIMPDSYEAIPDICMNTTCIQDDVFLSDDSSLIAEGTNLTLSCKSNYSNHSMLYWYKSNGTIYFLQAFGTDEELSFNIPDTRTFHSGMYICVKWVNRQSCCSSKSYLSVYKIPFYKYYLIIIGLIVATCLVICIFLSIRQTISLRTYTREFVEKHGKVKQLL